MNAFKKTAILAAALGISSAASGQNLMPPGEPPARPAPADGAIVTEAIQLPQWPAGFIGKPVDDMANIYRTLSMATEAALTPNGFDDFIRRFSEPDRERLSNGKASEQDAELNQRAAQLREKFRQKYAADFDINDASRVFDSKFTQLAQGEVSDPNLAKDRFPVRFRDFANEARMASARIEPDRDTATEKVKEPHLKIGRKVAIVTLKKDSAAPDGMNVSLVHEAFGRWRIDTPDSISAKQLRDNLLRQLTMLDEGSVNWPQNMNDTKRLFVQHVAAAIYDIPTAEPTRDTADQPTPMPPAELNDRIRNRP